jgi:hypothetical protein
MSYFDYRASQQLSARNAGSWYALLFALIRDADDENLYKLEQMWPDQVAEFRRRYTAPGGYLPNEQPKGE